ncbi:ATP-binding cassette domain-containing protein [Bacillus licheniformis]|nr:ATP-binding cassette domain-containing protein [Bacillus licheniformis]
MEAAVLEDNTIKINSDAGVNNLNQIIEKLMKNGAEIRSLEEKAPNLVPHSRNYILESVKKLNAMGCTIIYTSHYMEEVEEICTRIAIVDHGKIIAEGTKEQLKSIITNTKDILAGLYGLRGAHLHNRVEEALQFVGLSDKHKSFPKNFSGGMKRRLNIACAIAHRPKLIIMDEPTVGIELGANGAGKSTTIHMISSLLRSNEGEITILGKNIAKHRKFAKMNIGIVPQDLAIYEDLTAYENVKF